MASWAKGPLNLDKIGAGKGLNETCGRVGNQEFYVHIFAWSAAQYQDFVSKLTVWLKNREDYDQIIQKNDKDTRGSNDHNKVLWHVLKNCDDDLIQSFTTNQQYQQQIIARRTLVQERAGTVYKGLDDATGADCLLGCLYKTISYRIISKTKIKQEPDEDLGMADQPVASIEGPIVRGKSVNLTIRTPSISQTPAPPQYQTSPQKNKLDLYELAFEVHSPVPPANKWFKFSSCTEDPDQSQYSMGDFKHDMFMDRIRKLPGYNKDWKLMFITKHGTFFDLLDPIEFRDYLDYHNAQGTGLSVDLLRLYFEDATGRTARPSPAQAQLIDEQRTPRAPSAPTTTLSTSSPGATTRNQTTPTERSTSQTPKRRKRKPAGSTILSGNSNRTPAPRLPPAIKSRKVSKADSPLSPNQSTQPERLSAEQPQDELDADPTFDGAQDPSTDVQHDRRTTRSDTRKRTYDEANLESNNESEARVDVVHDPSEPSPAENPSKKVRFLSEDTQDVELPPPLPIPSVSSVPTESQDDELPSPLPAEAASSTPRKSAIDLDQENASAMDLNKQNTDSLDEDFDHRNLLSETDREVIGSGSPETRVTPPQRNTTVTLKVSPSVLVKYPRDNLLRSDAESWAASPEGTEALKFCADFRFDMSTEAIHQAWHSLERNNTKLLAHLRDHNANLQRQADTEREGDKNRRFYMLPAVLQEPEVRAFGKALNEGNLEKEGGFQAEPNDPVNVLKLLKSQIVFDKDSAGTTRILNPFQHWSLPQFRAAIKLLKLDITKGLWHSRTKFNVPLLRRAVYLWQLFDAARMFIQLRGSKAAGFQLLASQPGLGKSTTNMVVAVLEKLYWAISFERHLLEDSDSNDEKLDYKWAIDSHREDSSVPSSRRGANSGPTMEVVSCGHVWLPTVDEIEKGFLGDKYYKKAERDCWHNYRYTNKGYLFMGPWKLRVIRDDCTKDKQQYKLTEDDLQVLLPHFEALPLKEETTASQQHNVATGDHSYDDVEMVDDELPSTDVQYDFDRWGKPVLDCDDFDIENNQYKYVMHEASSDYILVISNTYVAKPGIGAFECWGEPRLENCSSRNPNLQQKYKSKYLRHRLGVPCLPRLISFDENHKWISSVKEAFAQLADSWNAFMEQFNITRRGIPKPSIIGISGTPFGENYMINFKIWMEAYETYMEKLLQKIAWHGKENKYIREYYKNINKKITGLNLIIKHRNAAIKDSANSRGFDALDMDEFAIDSLKKSEKDELENLHNEDAKILYDFMVFCELSDSTISGTSNGIECKPRHVTVECPPAVQQKWRETINDPAMKKKLNRYIKKEAKAGRPVTKADAWKAITDGNKRLQISATCPGLRDVAMRWHSRQVQRFEKDPDTVVNDHPEPKLNDTPWQDLDAVAQKRYLELRWTDAELQARQLVKPWPHGPTDFFQKYHRELLCVDDDLDAELVKALKNEDFESLQFTGQYQVVAAGAWLAHQRGEKFAFIQENLVEVIAIRTFIDTAFEDDKSVWCCKSETVENPARHNFSISTAEWPTNRAAAVKFSNGDMDEFLGLLKERRKNENDLGGDNFMWIDQINAEEDTTAAPKVLGATRILVDAVTIDTFRRLGVIGPLNQKHSITQALRRAVRAISRKQVDVFVSWAPRNFYSLYKMMEYCGFDLEQDNMPKGLMAQLEDEINRLDDGDVDQEDTEMPDAI